MKLRLLNRPGYKVWLNDIDIWGEAVGELAVAGYRMSCDAFLEHNKLADTELGIKILIRELIDRHEHPFFSR
jgi:hypothetical protein